MMVPKCVSSKSKTLPLAALRKAALNASSRSVRPMTIACPPLENIMSEARVCSIASSRQPASAVAMKFRIERLPSCRTVSGSWSHRALLTKPLSTLVTSEGCVIPAFYLNGWLHQVTGETTLLIHRAYIAVIPPSTNSNEPVTYDASLDARKRMQAATSSRSEEH